MIGLQILDRQIANPEYFVDESPYKIPTIDSIGIDIWTMDKGIIFDNIVVDKNPEKVLKIGTRLRREKVLKPKICSLSLFSFLALHLRDGETAVFMFFIFSISARFLGCGFFFCLAPRFGGRRIW